MSPARKAPPRAPKGTTPEQVNLNMPEGGKERLKRAARKAGDPSVNAFLRRLVEAECARLKV